MASAGWDVFFSYPRADYPLAAPLIAALNARGLRTFVDRSHVRDFTSISGALADNLARSTLLVAFYSERYLFRRSCNYELTAAFVAGQREGDPCRRIAVVNPHASFDHIHPTELRDRRSLALYEYNDRLAELAGIIEDRVRRVGGVIGTPPDAARTPWYPPPPPVGSVGVQPYRGELWAAHSALRPGAAAYHTGSWEGGTARVCALDQPTATAFAQDYALQFSAAYPGGVFWFSLAERPGEHAPDTFARRLATMGDLVGVGGGPPEETARRLAGIAEHVERADGPSLWVLDGLRGPHDREAPWMLRNPQARGSTLITGQVTRYDGPGTLVDITEPDGEVARAVLLQGGPPLVAGRPGQEVFADRIVRHVGGHPAALAAAQRLLNAADPPDLAYENVHRQLGDPQVDALDFDARYSRLTARLANEVSALGDGARAAVVWASLGTTWAVSAETVARALSLLDGAGKRGPMGVLAVLGEQPYARLESGRLRVHPLLARAVRYRIADSELMKELSGVWEEASRR